jgi:hypothetical protein
MCVSLFSTIFIPNFFSSDKYLASYCRHACRNACTICTRTNCSLSSDFDQNQNRQKIFHNKCAVLFSVLPFGVGKKIYRSFGRMHYFQIECRTTPCKWRQYVSPKRWKLSTRPHSVTEQRVRLFVVTASRLLHLTFIVNVLRIEFNENPF